MIPFSFDHSSSLSISLAIANSFYIRYYPRPAAGHLRQGRQLRRVDCHAGRHEGAVFGFDLCSPNTSVSMTINGPAPTILAFFMNTALDQQVDKFVEQHRRSPSSRPHRRVHARRCNLRPCSARDSYARSK